MRWSTKNIIWHTVIYISFLHCPYLNFKILFHSEILKFALPSSSGDKLIKTGKNFQSWYSPNYTKSDTAFLLYLFSLHFVLLKELKKSSASSLTYHLRRSRKPGNPTSKNCSNEIHFGKGGGKQGCYFAKFSRRIIQHVTTQSTEFTIRKHTEKIIWGVRLDVQLRVWNLLLRSPCGFSPVYTAIALLSSR